MLEKQLPLITAFIKYKKKAFKGLSNLELCATTENQSNFQLKLIKSKLIFAFLASESYRCGE